MTYSMIFNSIGYRKIYIDIIVSSYRYVDVNIYILIYRLYVIQFKS